MNHWMTYFVVFKYRTRSILVALQVEAKTALVEKSLIPFSMEDMLEAKHKNIKFSGNTNLHIQFQTVRIQESHQEILDTAD